MGKLKNIQKYSILIIAAGMGKRMGTLGKNLPKCLLKINNVSLIEKNLYILKSLGFKKVNMIVGYKSQKIIDYLLKKKIIKINFIKIDNYKYGHSYTLYYFKKFWNNLKKPLIFLHADIIFEKKFLVNIIKSKKKNIIGVKHKFNHQIKRNSLVVQINKKYEVETINYKKTLNKFYGEVIGINKFSTKTLKKIHNFMDRFFKVNINKKLAWEIFLDIFIKLKFDKFYVLKKQNYFWININKPSDFQKAQKLKL